MNWRHVIGGSTFDDEEDAFVRVTEKKNARRKYLKASLFFLSLLQNLRFLSFRDKYSDLLPNWIKFYQSLLPVRVRSDWIMLEDG